MISNSSLSHRELISDQRPLASPTARAWKARPTGLRRRAGLPPVQRPSGTEPANAWLGRPQEELCRSIWKPQGTSRMGRRPLCISESQKAEQAEPETRDEACQDCLPAIVTRNPRDTALQQESQWGRAAHSTACVHTRAGHPPGQEATKRHGKADLSVGGSSMG